MLFTDQNTFHSLELGFDICNSVSRKCLNLKYQSNSSLHKNYHSFSKSEFESRLSPNLVVLQSVAIFKYLISKVKLLLSFINAFFIFNLLFDLCNRIVGHYIKVNDLLSLSFDMDPHDVSDLDHQSFFVLDVIIG